MNNRHSGACLCGEVRFEIEGDFERFFLCHCEHCRKDTGSAHAANLFSSKATLRWLAGKELVTEFTLPGTRHARSFCRICGSALPMQENSEWIVVPAGSLNTAVPLRPDAHIFVASRANWDDALEQIPAFDRFPS